MININNNNNSQVYFYKPVTFILNLIQKIKIFFKTRNEFNFYKLLLIKLR